MIERAGTPHADAMQSKASIFRGFVVAIEKEGLLEPVRARVSAETRGFIDSPPPASTWMPSWPSEQIAEAVTEIAGVQRWRRIAYLRHARRRGAAAARGHRGLLATVSVRSPRRCFRACSTHAVEHQGIDYQFTSTGEREGEMIVTYPHRRDLPMSTYFAVAGALEVVFELCGARGTIDDPETGSSCLSAIRRAFACTGSETSHYVWA